MLFPSRESRAPALRWDDDQHLRMDDGGTVSVQWLGLDAPPDTPVIVVLPTIMGSGDDLWRTIAALRRNTGGWIVAVCNRRGHAALPLTAPRVNTMGSTADLGRQLEAIEARRPGVPLYGIGISAGSGLLVRYLGEAGADSKLRAGISHCPGYDISRAFDLVHPVYDRIMTGRLIEYFIRRHQSVWAGVRGVEYCSRARTMSEYHHRQYVLSGHEDKADYYRHSNPMEVADGIEVPLLVINAEDDPVCARDNVYAEMDRMQQRPRLTLALTKRGGHCGFFDGTWARRSWSDRLWVEYLRAVQACA
ncbi:MAG: alpha/beta fold hydrolase [Myxococcota bacterium]